MLHFANYIFNNENQKPNIKIIQKAFFFKQNTSKQAVSLRSLPLFRSAVPVGRRQKKPPPSVSQALHSTKKKSSSEKEQLFFFCAISFLVFTRSLPSFGRAYASTIPLHFVTVIRSLNAPFHSAKSSLIPFTAFQPYYVCRPIFFQRLLFRTAIVVGSAPFLLRFSILRNPFTLITKFLL